MNITQLSSCRAALKGRTNSVRCKFRVLKDRKTIQKCQSLRINEKRQRDADLLLDLLLQHRDKLRRLTLDNEATRRVQNLVEERRKLVEEKTAQLNRLSGYLKVYFPQMLEWFAKLDTKLACEFLEHWPSLEELQSSSPAEVRKFFRRRRGRHGELTEWRMQGIGQAMPAIRDRAVIEAKRLVP
jgi:hypothetical protein